MRKKIWKSNDVFQTRPHILQTKNIYVTKPWIFGIINYTQYLQAPLYYVNFHVSVLELFVSWTSGWDSSRRSCCCFKTASLWCVNSKWCFLHLILLFWNQTLTCKKQLIPEFSSNKISLELQSVAAYEPNKAVPVRPYIVVFRIPLRVFPIAPEWKSFELFYSYNFFYSVSPTTRDVSILSLEKKL